MRREDSKEEFVTDEEEALDDVALALLVLDVQLVLQELQLLQVVLVHLVEEMVEMMEFVEEVEFVEDVEEGGVGV